MTSANFSIYSAHFTYLKAALYRVLLFCYSRRNCIMNELDALASLLPVSCQSQARRKRGAWEAHASCMPVACLLQACCKPPQFILTLKYNQWKYPFKLKDLPVTLYSQL